jgi:hypothetical protein
MGLVKGFLCIFIFVGQASGFSWFFIAMAGLLYAG